MEIDTTDARELLLLTPAKFKSYSKYLLQLYSDNDNNGEEDGQNRECVNCFQLFSSKQKLAAQYRTHKYCDIIDMVDKHTRNPVITPSVIHVGEMGASCKKRGLYIAAILL